MQRRAVLILALIFVLIAGTLIYLFAFTPLTSQITTAIGSGDDTAQVTPTVEPTPMSTPTPTPTPTLTETPSPTPTPLAPGVMPPSTAKAVYMVDVTTGKVMTDVASDQELPMASTAKIMTALLATERINLDQPVTIPDEAAQRIDANGESSAQLHPGDRIRMREVLAGLLVQSGADAAVTLADATSGSVDAFVTEMNAYAQRLGLAHTHFVDPDGISDQSVTSAADLVKLSEKAMQNSTIAYLVSQTDYHVAPSQNHLRYDWQTTNALLTSYPGVFGIKTGHSNAAGFCLAFADKQPNGHIIYGAILGSPDEEARTSDVTKLLDWTNYVLTH